MFQPLALAMMDEAGYNGIEDEHIEKLAVFFRMLSRNFILPEICRHVFFVRRILSYPVTGTKFKPASFRRWLVLCLIGRASRYSF